MPDKLPTVFLSSTFFDLRQVRADLADFVTGELGYRLLASEFATFPIDPGVDTIENCRRRVGDAHVFVLVIGGRYGSRADSGQSITNIEYLVARELGLPIYVFVLRDILTLLRHWEVNPDANFAHAVDSTDLFVFVRQITSSDRVWVTSFETAQEIVSGLRTQFAYLMARGLDTLATLRATPDDLEGFSGSALKLILEKPGTWLGDLFCLLLRREFDDAAVIRERHHAGVAFGTGEHVEEQDMPTWIKARLSEVERSIHQIEILVAQSINNALRSKEPQALRRAANHIGAVYRECLEWAVRVRRAVVPSHWRETTDLLSRAYDAALDSLEALPSRFEAEVQRILDSGISQDVRIKLPFVVGVPDEFHAAFRRALHATH